MADPLDTNVLVRFLVEDPGEQDEPFAGVLPFFEKLEHGNRTALLPSLVLFQCYFVLTSYYEVPGPVAAEKLTAILSLKGLRVPEKAVLRTCLETLTERSVDLVDAYLAALCRHKRLEGVFSFDEDLRSLGIKLLPVG